MSKVVDINGKELRLFDIVEFSDSDDWDMDGIITGIDGTKIRIFPEKVAFTSSILSLFINKNKYLNLLIPV